MSQIPITPNHMNVYWHDYAGRQKDLPVTQAGLHEKSAFIGRAGLMLLSCGTRSLESSERHEYSCGCTLCYLYRKYRASFY